MQAGEFRGDDGEVARGWVGPCKDGFEPAASLDQLATGVPGAAQRSRESQRGLGLGFLRPGECGAEVVELSFERVERSALAVVELGDPLSCEREVVVAMRTAHPRCASCYLQPFKRVLADRLQHPEATFASRFPPPEQVLVDERFQLVEGSGADVLCCLERAAAVEDREAGEELLLVMIEQGVAPVDRRTQRLLARSEIARPSLQ